MFKNRKEDRFLFIKQNGGLRLSVKLRNQERSNREIAPFLIFISFRRQRIIYWEIANVGVA